MDEITGQQIDQYLVERLIARGGMAGVYLALDVTLQRRVALKVMTERLDRRHELVARFQREAQTIANLQHPNIIQIYSIGQSPLGQPYLAMQFVDGGSLHDWLTSLAREGIRMSAVQALATAHQIAAALDTAHRAGVIHRDLKPGNILLRADGTPIVTDFGIAAVKTATTRLTQTGGILGTPYYMAPEQALGQPVDGRADLYSLGVILYEMLAGQVPFSGDSPLAVLNQHIHEPPPPLNLRRSDLAGATYQLVDVCLRKEPGQRFQSAADLAGSLRATFIQERGAPAPPSTPEPARKGRRLDRRVVALTILGAMLMGVGLWQVLATFRLAPTRQPAVTLAAVAEDGSVAATATRIEQAATLAATSTPVPAPTDTVPPTAIPTIAPTATAEAIAPSPAAAVTPAGPQPVIVPAAGRIVFTCYINDVDDICTIGADGSGERRLTNVGATDFYPSFTPDGGQILFSSRREGGFLMYSMNPDGSDQRQLQPTDLGGVYAPALSPDGQKYVFTVASGANQQIWVMNENGTDLTQITLAAGNNLDPVWSPDGEQIAFASDREQGEFAHYIVNADGSGERRLETGVAQIGGRSDWSPDGSWLAFYAGPRSDRDIYLVATDGSAVYQLTDGGSNLAPSFSPDGNWIAFTSDRDGDAEIFVMRVDGSDVTQLTFNGRPDWQPRWGP